MSGGKGGSTTSEVQIPAYIEEASKANLARANEISQLGYTPYYGPDVAAPSQLQQAGFATTGQAASAFGLPGGGMTGMEGMPQAMPMAGGGYGYSSAPIYEASLGRLQERAPAQYDFIRGMFIDPVTGQRPNVPFSRGGTIYEAPEDEAQPIDTPFTVNRSFPQNVSDVRTAGNNALTFSDVTPATSSAGKGGAAPERITFNGGR